VVEGGVHLALVHGQLSPARPTPVRVHVHRGLLDEALDPAAPSWPLHQVAETIAAQESGVIVLLSYHESAEQLAARIAMRAEQSPPPAPAGHGERPDSPANLRMLGAGGQILADLKVGKVIALGREKRTHGLSGFGLEIVTYVADRRQLEQWIRQHA